MEEQEEEREALKAIFEDNYHGLSSSPPTFMVRLEEGGAENISGPLYLKFIVPELYPNVLPSIKVVTKSLQLPTQETLIAHLYDLAQSLLGEPMIFSLIDAAKDWLLSNEIQHTQKEMDENLVSIQSVDDIEEEVEKITSTEEVHFKGGLWKFVVGLVGKPSAGKSTFFNAATCSAEAKVAAHPFTTIDPNVGTAFCTVKCPCFSFDKKCDAEFGHSRNGERNLPVLIKDVAGLVPGAADGKGKGNRFLNDLCDADVLIHIVDASGCTDELGKCTTGYDPMQDIEWLPNEIFRWIYDNVLQKWENVLRKPSKLIDLFTGYHASRSLIYLAFHNAGISLQTLEEDIHLWNVEVKLSKLVKEFMKLRFPIVIALNKADLQTSENNITRIQEKYGTDKTIAISAESECFLQRLDQKGLLEYVSDYEISIKQDHTDARVKGQWMEYQRSIRYGVNGVVRALNLAVASRHPLFAFPVANLETLKSLSTSRNEKGSLLKHCVMMKPGSTVQSLYEMLLYALKLISGKYVRAEGMDFLGTTKHILKKEEKIDGNNCIVQIMTSKRT